MRTTPNWTKLSPSHVHDQHLFSLSTWSRWRTHLANDFFSLPMSVNCTVQANYRIGQWAANMHYCSPNPDVEANQLSIFLMGKTEESKENTSLRRRWKFHTEIPEFEPWFLLLWGNSANHSSPFFFFFLNTISRWDKQERTVSYPGDVIVGYVLVNQITLTRLTELALKLQ